MKFREYNEKESELPIDQHMLISLSAPRPVYVASASKDLWADPKGEFLSAKGAIPVYNLFNLNNDELISREVLEYENPILSGFIGHHVRRGRHNIIIYDWKNVILFSGRAPISTLFR